jgi:hypothetical protein
MVEKILFNYSYFLVLKILGNSSIGDNNKSLRLVDFLIFETNDGLNNGFVPLKRGLYDKEAQTTLMMTFPLGCTFSKYQKASDVLLNG